MIRGFFSSNFRDNRKTMEEGEGRNDAFRFPFSEFRLLCHQEQRRRRDKGHQTRASCSQCSQPKPVESPQVALFYGLQSGTGRQHSAPTSETDCGEQVLEGCIAQGCAVGSRREVQHPTVESA